MSAEAAKGNETLYGFKWGAAEVTRLFSRDGWVTIGIKTPKGEWQVYVTKTGKLRVYGPDAREWWPVDA